MNLPAPLTDPWFEAEFYGGVTADGWRTAHADGSPITLHEAQGLLLWCPCGYGKLDADGHEAYPLDLSLNKGRPHAILVPFANPPSGVHPPANHGPQSRGGPSRPRWRVDGDGLHDLTLSPSVSVGEVECWHGFVRLGVVSRA